MFRKIRGERDFLSIRHGDRRIRGDNRGPGKRGAGGILSCLILCCFLFSASVAFADDSLWNKGIVDSTAMRYPADFNVFSFNNIEGLWNNAVTFQHIEGPVAAGDSLVLKSFGLNHDTTTDHPAAAVVGRYVDFDYGGTVYGDVYYGVSYSAPPNQITYMPETVAGPIPGTPRQPVDFIQAHNDLTYYSDLLSQLAPTAGWTTISGAIHFVCSGISPLEVFEIDAGDLDSPGEIWLDNLQANPIILINVKGDHNVNISNTSIRGEGVNSSRILWNFPVVKDINITGIAFRGSVLAPWADLEVKWGSFSGTLVANNVTGSAELYHHPFEGYEALQYKIENEVLLDLVQVTGIHLASEYKVDAPTTVGIVTWSVDEAEIGTIQSAEIRFWKNEPGAPVMVAPVDTNDPSSYYRTLLFGMKANTTYIFQVFVTTSGGNFTSMQYDITTGALPAGLNLPTVTMPTNEKNNRAQGFIITEMFDDNVAFILDMDGNIVWWHQYVCTTGAVEYMCRAMMSTDGKYMWMTFDMGKDDFCFLHKVSMDTLETETFHNGASHDLAVVDDETIAYLNWTEFGENRDWYPSVYEWYTLDNGIIGELEIFETADVAGYDPWPYPPIDIEPVPKLNALRYYNDEVLDDLYPEGLYSVADKAFDIIVIDPAVPSQDPNDKIVIRLSNVSNISYDPVDYWYHGHQLLYDSSGITGIIVFYTTPYAYNAVVEYSLTQGFDGWRANIEYEYHTTNMYTFGFGDVQRLPNGNTLVTGSYSGKIVELDSSWNEVMRLEIEGVTSNRLGYSLWRPNIDGPVEDETPENPVQIVNSHLASEDNTNAPTTVGIVTWSVDETVITSIDSAVIKFWKSETGAPVMEAPVDLTEPQYRTLLLGMKPESTYIFRVYVTTSDGKNYMSDVNMIQTGSLPADIFNVTMTEDYPELRDPGFIVSCMRTGDEAIPDWAFILDTDGDIVWWYKCTDSDLNDMNRAALSYDGKYMWMVFADSKFDDGNMLRVSLDMSEAPVKLAVGASHDFTPVDDNTIAYICWNEGAPDINRTWDAYPSVYEMVTTDDGEIIELNEIFETANVAGYVPWPYGDDYLISPEDPHLNAIHYYKDEVLDAFYPGGLYSLSDRAMDIFVFDPNGNIIIRLSDVVNLNEENPMDYNPFELEETNHGHQLLYDETGITGIVLFNNGCNVNSWPRSSSVCEYSLRLEGGVWKGEPVHPRWEYETSFYLGDVQRLSNGNTLVSVSAQNVIIERDVWGQIMKLEFDHNVGYSCWRPTLYGPPPYGPQM